MGGRAVRLVEGRFEDATTYHDDPLEAAQSWVDAGARYLHVVDLDGAKEGEPRSIEHLRRIVQGTGVPVQYGGGLRTVDAVRDALRAGAERAIVGTAAFRDVDFLDEILATFGPRIVVSVDVRGGYISTAGWTQTTELPRRGGDPPPAGPRRRVVRLHERRPRRHARGPGPEEVQRDRRGRARPLPVLRRHRPPRGSADARPAPAGQPLRRDRRQGAVREALHDRRRPSRPRRSGRVSPWQHLASVLLEREQTQDTLSRAVGDAAGAMARSCWSPARPGSARRAWSARSPPRCRTTLACCCPRAMT